MVQKLKVPVLQVHATHNAPQQTPLAHNQVCEITKCFDNLQSTAAKW